MAIKDQKQQVQILQSINATLMEQKRDIAGLRVDLQKQAKRDRQTSAEEAKERLKQKKMGAARDMPKPMQNIAAQSNRKKAEMGGLAKMLGLGALGASIGLAFQDEIIGGFKSGVKSLTDTMFGKDSIIGDALNGVAGLLDELKNPLGALTTGFAVGLNRLSKFTDRMSKVDLGDSLKRALGIQTKGPTPTPSPTTTTTKATPDKPEKVARTAQQTRIESDDRGRNLSEKQKAELGKKGLGVKKDGTLGKLDPDTGKFMAKGGGVSAADTKKALDDVGAKGPSAKAVKMADEVEAPRARASQAKVVGPGTAPAATSQAEVDKRMAAKPGAAPAAPAPDADAAKGAGAAPKAEAIKPAGPATTRTKTGSFMKFAKRVGGVLKGIYDTIVGAAARFGKMTGMKWLAKGIARALGPISALITLFMLGKNELDPSISDEKRMENRFVMLGEAAGGVLGAVVGALVLTVIPFVGTLVGGVLGGIIGAFVGGNLGLFIYRCCKDGVKPTILAVFKSGKEIAAKAWEYLKKKGFKGVVKDAGELLGKGFESAAGLVKDIGEGIADMASSGYDAAKETAGEVAGVIKGAAGAVADKASELGGKALGAVGGAASAVGSKVSGAVSSVMGAIGFGSDKPEKPMSPEEKMAKLDQEIADTEEDLEGSYWIGSREDDEKKLAALKKQKQALMSGGAMVNGVMVPGGSAVRQGTDEELAEFGVGPLAANGDTKISGAAAIGAQAIDGEAGGGDSAAAIQEMVKQNGQIAQAVISAMAKVDAKASSGGGGGTTIIPSGSPPSGGIGRKTVIGATPF